MFKKFVHLRCQFTEAANGGVYENFRKFARKTAGWSWPESLQIY